MFKKRNSKAQAVRDSGWTVDTPNAILEISFPSDLTSYADVILNDVGICRLKAGDFRDSFPSLWMF